MGNRRKKYTEEQITWNNARVYESGEAYGERADRKLQQDDAQRDIAWSRV